MDLLGIVRLSDFRESSVSPEQQIELMSGYARLHGHRIVHIVRDDDVSGDYGPFHPRRATAEWLNERHGEFEGIITRKIDRVARNAEQTLRLLRWAKNRGKVLISVNDGIDTSSEAGKTMAKFMAVVAEMELDAIKQRARQSYKHLTQEAKRWAGGQVPFGYRPACLNCGEIPRQCACPAGDRRGYQLVPDETYAPVLRQMVARFLDEESPWSLGGIARWLNSTGVPVSRNIMRTRSGKEPAATTWTPDSVGKILRSCAMLGAIEVTDVLERDDETGKVTKRSPRRPLYDDDGELVLRAEPLVSYEDWAAVQAIMSANGGKDQGRHPRTPLLKIGFCGLCGGQLYVAATQANRYYACGQSSFRVTVPAGSRCPARRFPADLLEAEAARMVLEFAGDWQMMTPSVQPAEEYSGSLAQVTAAIANLWDLAESGVFRDRAGQFRERLDTLEQRRGELQARPSRPAETTWLPAGKSVRDYWASLEPGERWDYLRAMGVKMSFARGGMPKPPPGVVLSGPITVEDIPRWTLETLDGSDIMVWSFFGSLADMRAAATKLPVPGVGLGALPRRRK